MTDSLLTDIRKISSVLGTKPFIEQLSETRNKAIFKQITAKKNQTEESFECS